MTATPALQTFSVHLNIHDHSFQHARTNFDALSWTEIKQYLQNLSTHPIPDNSCAYDIEISSNANNAIIFYNERGHAPIISDAHKPHPASNVHVQMNMTSHQNCGTTHCLDNIKAGKCCDKYIIETLGTKLFADKYTKTK